MWDRIDLERLAKLDAVWVAPNIPARKVRNARVAHRLEPDETVWMVYDDTLWGGASDGLVLTDRRVSAKRLFRSPVSIHYVDAVPVEQDGLTLKVGGLSFSFEPPGWGPFHVECIAEFLQKQAPVELPSPERRAWTDHVLTLARHHLSEIKDVLFAPTLPEAKLDVVRRTHDLPVEETILVFCDLTVFGGAREHWALTDRRLVVKPFLDTARSFVWNHWLSAPLEYTRTRWPHHDSIFEEPGWFEFHQALGALDAREPRNLELERIVHTNPGDRTARAIYVDWLLEQDHPRGELATMQQQGLPTDAWLELHRSEFLPDGYPGDYHVTWMLGHWDTLVVETDEWQDELTLLHRFSSLLRHPNARFLREVTILPPEDGHNPSLHDAVMHLLESVTLPSLQRLETPFDPLPRSIRSRFPRLGRTEGD